MISHLSRVTAALLGGYAFTWGFTALGITGLVAAGTDYHEAETAMLMVAFLVFLGIFLWAFATASLKRVWLVMTAGPVLMSGAAWALQQSLIG